MAELLQANRILAAQEEMDEVGATVEIEGTTLTTSFEVWRPGEEITVSLLVAGSPDPPEIAFLERQLVDGEIRNVIRSQDVPPARGTLLERVPRPLAIAIRVFAIALLGVLAVVLASVGVANLIQYVRWLTERPVRRRLGEFVESITDLSEDQKRVALDFGSPLTVGPDGAVRKAFGRVEDAPGRSAEPGSDEVKARLRPVRYVLGVEDRLRALLGENWEKWQAELPKPLPTISTMMTERLGTTVLATAATTVPAAFLVLAILDSLPL